MKTTLLLAAASTLPRLFQRFFQRFFQMRRRTWVLLGMGLLALIGLLIWSIIALLGWLFTQAQGLSTTAPEAARSALVTLEQQVEQVAPDAREKLAAGLDELVPLLKPEDRPQRDVSGADIAPVARYPGLPRTYWRRDGRQVYVHYEGPADYPTVLNHYIRGFGALGYTQELQSAAPTAETHAWSQGRQRYLVTIAGEPRGKVSVQIETTLE